MRFVAAGAVAVDVHVVGGLALGVARTGRPGPAGSAGAAAAALAPAVRAGFATGAHACLRNMGLASEKQQALNTINPGGGGEGGGEELAGRT